MAFEPSTQPKMLQQKRWKASHSYFPYSSHRSDAKHTQPSNTEKTALVTSHRGQHRRSHVLFLSYEAFLVESPQLPFLI